MTPRDVARVLFRHWRMMTLISSCVIVLGLVVIAIFPRSYASESKLMIRVGRESVGLDPTATTGQTIMLQKTQEDEVNSALNILTSRVVLQRVADRIGAERILEDLPSGKLSASDADAGVQKTRGWISSTLAALRLSDPGTEIDRAVRHLEKNTAVWAPRRSVVINVRYTASSPELAHDVVKAMNEVFLEEHSRLSQADGSLEFFSQQVDKLYSDLSAAQAELRDRKNAYQLTSLANRRSALETGQDAMRQKVYDLKMRENDLISRYTDEYPPLRDVRRQRRLAEQMLVGLPSSSGRVENLANEDSESQVQPAAYVAAKPIADDAARPQDTLGVELQTLNDQEYELAQLEREVKLLETKYAMHVEKLEQARVNDALGHQQITNVKVAQPATLVYKPVAPKKALLMAAALVVAFVGSVGSAFAAEGLDQTLRTTSQVEAQLGLPVLASSPYRGRRRRQKVVSRATGATSSGETPSHNGTDRYAGYRNLLTVLRPAGENGHRHGKTVGVVGCGASKLRSRAAGDVAIEAAASGTEPVLLIDADARHHRIAERFHLTGAPGWREVLAGKAVAKDCVRRSERVNLAVMGPGDLTDEAPVADTTAGSLGSLDDVKNGYGLIVVDLPPTSQAGRTAAFDGWIDEAVLVVEAERTRVQAAQRARDMLNLAGIHVVGVILANRREHIPRWLYERL